MFGKRFHLKSNSFPILIFKYEWFNWFNTVIEEQDDVFDIIDILDEDVADNIVVSVSGNKKKSNISDQLTHQE